MNIISLIKKNKVKDIKNMAKVHKLCYIAYNLGNAVNNSEATPLKIR